MCMRCLYIILCCALGPILTAQDTLLYENFQSGTLNGFLSLDVDGLPLAEDFETLEGGFQVIPVAGANDFRALGVSTFRDGGTANNWLISPPIAITSNASSLQWEGSSLSGDPEQAESYEVLISRTGTEMADFNEVLSVIDAETTGSRREVALNSLAGTTVHIAFRQNGQDRFALTIDNILVTQLGSEIAAELRVVGDKYQSVSYTHLTLPTKA